MYAKGAEHFHQSVASNNPEFMDLFGFYLALDLLGKNTVMKAMAACPVTCSDFVNTLHWRSPFRDSLGDMNIDKGSDRHNASTPNNADIFFIDVTFEFTTRGSERMLHTKFGALAKTSHQMKINNENIEGGLYIQSPPWTLSSLEEYAAGSGICVEETGPRGMAENVGTSLTQLQEPKAEISNVDGSGSIDARTTTLAVLVDTFHSMLSERVTLIDTTVKMSDGHVGTTALSMMKASFSQMNEHGADLESALKSSSTSAFVQQASNDSDQKTFLSWRRTPALVKQTPKSRIACSTNTPKKTTMTTTTTSNLTEISSLLPQEIVTNPSSKINTKTNESPSKTEPTIPAVSASDAAIASASKLDQNATSLKRPARRRGVVHGASRQKRRKKGKLSFGKS